MKLEGGNNLEARLKETGSKSSDGGVVIGYTQQYALEVHENLSMRHAPGKTAKYLERPARELATQLGEIIRSIYQKTKDMRRALLIAGLRLQRASQEIVPIDTGALKNSAFTALDEDLQAAADAAYAKSESIRQQNLKAAEKMAKRKGIGVEEALRRRKDQRSSMRENQ